MTLVLLIALMTAAPQPPLQGLAGDLAAKIAGAIAPETRLHLAVSEDDPADTATASVFAAISKALSERGLRIVDDRMAVAVTISCSRNLRERVCAADVRKADNRLMLLSSVIAPTSDDAGDERGPTLDLRHVIGQSLPILDIATADDRLIVLDPAELTIYSRGDRNAWQRHDTQPIAASRPWPRDVRGRLRVSGSAIEAYLPGVVCRATLGRLNLTCADERQPWPVGVDNEGIAPGRNDFTTPEGLRFYGFAPAASTGVAGLIAGSDARLLFVDSGRQPLGPAAGSAIDVVGVTSTCSADPLALVASAGGTGDRDVLRLVAVSGTRLAATAPSLLLPGRLTALWTASANAATAVVQDATTGRYEAYHIDVGCSR